jgi:hypothetical protein
MMASMARKMALTETMKALMGLMASKVLRVSKEYHCSMKEMVVTVADLMAWCFYSQTTSVMSLRTIKAVLCGFYLTSSLILMVVNTVRVGWVLVVIFDLARKHS